MGTNAYDELLKEHRALEEIHANLLKSYANIWEKYVNQSKNYSGVLQTSVDVWDDYQRYVEEHEGPEGVTALYDRANKLKE